MLNLTTSPRICPRNIKEAIETFPLILSYSRDLIKYFDRIDFLYRRAVKLNSIISSDPSKQKKLDSLINYIEYLILEKDDNYKSIVEEIEGMGLKLCLASGGRIDIPVRFNQFTEIAICVGHNTCLKNLFYHPSKDSKFLYKLNL